MTLCDFCFAELSTHSSVAWARLCWSCTREEGVDGGNPLVRCVWGFLVRELSLWLRGFFNPPWFDVVDCIPTSTTAKVVFCLPFGNPGIPVIEHNVHLE